MQLKQLCFFLVNVINMEFFFIFFQKTTTRGNQIYDRGKAHKKGESSGGHGLCEANETVAKNHSARSLFVWKCIPCSGGRQPHSKICMWHLDDPKWDLSWNCPHKYGQTIILEEIAVLFFRNAFGEPLPSFFLHIDNIRYANFLSKCFLHSNDRRTL